MTMRGRMWNSDSFAFKLRYFLFFCCVSFGVAHPNQQHALATAALRKVASAGGVILPAGPDDSSYRFRT